MKKVFIALTVLAAVGIGAAGGAKLIVVREALSGQRVAVAAQWAEVDAALQRRAELIPGLADAIWRMARPGVGAFPDVGADRAALAAAQSPEQKIQANDRLSADLARLQTIAQAEPKLRSNKLYLRLQDEIAGAENDIAVERRKYNEILEHYNAQIQRFPDNVVASLSGYTRNDAYFQTDGAPGANPKVRF